MVIGPEAPLEAGVTDELHVDEVPPESPDAVHVPHTRLLDDEPRERVLDHRVAELAARERSGDEQSPGGARKRRKAMKAAPNHERSESETEAAE